MDVTEAIRSKRAVRTFDAKAVPQEVIEAILDAGRRSQSSKNTQPWQFILVQNRDTLRALSQLGTWAGHLAGANFAVVLVGKEASAWNAFDLGQAAAYLQLAAWEQGVGSCIAAVWPEDAVRDLLDIPAGQSVFAALSFGYPAADFTPAQMGGRKPLADVVRQERW